MSSRRIAEEIILGKERLSKELFDVEIVEKKTPRKFNVRRAQA